MQIVNDVLMESVRIVDGCLMYRYQTGWNKAVNVVEKDGAMLESMVLGEGQLRYLAKKTLKCR